MFGRVGRVVFALFVAYAPIAHSATWSMTTVGGQMKRLELSGEIKRGDHDALIKMIRADPESFLFTRAVSLRSPGGDVQEALKIADLLSGLYLAGGVYENQVCASSCFLIYVSLPIRQVLSGARLGVHRPTFASFESSSNGSRDLRQEFEDMSVHVEQYLERMNVPKRIIDLMFKSPSNEIVWLSREAISEIGGQSLFFDEYKLAECGEEPRSGNPEKGIAYINCLFSVGSVSRAQTIKRVAKGSAGWVQLEKKYPGLKRLP